MSGCGGKGLLTLVNSPKNHAPAASIGGASSVCRQMEADLLGLVSRELFEVVSLSSTRSCSLDDSSECCPTLSFPQPVANFTKTDGSRRLKVHPPQQVGEARVVAEGFEGFIYCDKRQTG